MEIWQFLDYHVYQLDGYYDGSTILTGCDWSAVSQGGIFINNYNNQLNAGINVSTRRAVPAGLSSNR